MATEHVNLLPKKMRKRNPNFTLIAGASWILVLAGAGVLAVIDTYNLHRQRVDFAQMNDDTKTVSDNIDQINGKIESTELLKRNMITTKAFLSSKATWAQPLKELSLLVPPRVWIAKLATQMTDHGEIFLEVVGSSPSTAKIAQLFEALEKSFYFNSVRLKKAEKLGDIAPDLYQFRFEIDIPRIVTRGENAKAK